MPDGTTHVESFTISWLPAWGPVRPLRLWPQRGNNFTLQETFAISAEQQGRVSMWGPYEISALRYDWAVAQYARLDSGKVRYRVFDSLGFNKRIMHCVHAVTNADPVLRKCIQPVLQVGEPGTSRLAARYLRNDAFINPSVTHDWIIPAIGADQYPVVRRVPGEFIRREFR
jgi:hypothetical protein